MSSYEEWKCVSMVPIAVLCTYNKGGYHENKFAFFFLDKYDVYHSTMKMLFKVL